MKKQQLDKLIPDTARTLEIQGQVNYQRFYLRILVGFCLLITCFVHIDLCIAAVASDFQYFKLVQMPGIGENQIVYITLDSEIYKFCRKDFADVRLFDAKKNELSRVIQQTVNSKTEIVSEYFNGEIEDLVKLDENQIEIIVKINEDIGSITGIRIRTALNDFEKSISVFGQTEDDQWQPIVTNAVIYDFKRFADVRNLEIRFEQSEYSHLKLRINDVTDAKESRFRKLRREFGKEGVSGNTTEEIYIESAPFRVDAVQLIKQFEKKGTMEPVIDKYKVKSINILDDEVKGQTVIEVQTNREPMTSFILDTETVNFSRNVKIQAFEKEEWRDLAEGNIFNLTYQNSFDGKVEIKFAESRFNKYRIIIDNGDNQPLKILGVTAHGNVYQMVYLAQERTAYQVFWGSEDIAQPKYDTAAITTLINKGVPIKHARMGRGFENPDYGKKDKKKGFDFLNSKAFFGIVVLFMIVILGSALFNAIKKKED